MYYFNQLFCLTVLYAINYEILIIIVYKWHPQRVVRPKQYKASESYCDMNKWIIERALVYMYFVEKSFVVWALWQITSLEKLCWNLGIDDDSVRGRLCTPWNMTTSKWRVFIHSIFSTIFFHSLPCQIILNFISAYRSVIFVFVSKFRRVIHTFNGISDDLNLLYLHSEGTIVV